MNKLILFTALLVLSECGSTIKTMNLSKVATKRTTHKDADYRYNEVFQLIPHTTFNLIKDEFGKGYTKMIPGKKTTFRYQYTKISLDSTIMDVGYKQEIFFEMPLPFREIKLKDDELSKLNLLVKKLCFCRDAGAYLIKKGLLEIKIPDKNKIEINLEILNPPVRLEKTKIHQIIRVK